MVLQNVFIMGQDNRYSEYTKSVLKLSEGYSVEFLEEELRQISYLIKQGSKFSQSFFKVKNK